MALHLADSVNPTMSSGEQIFTNGNPDCKYLAVMKILQQRHYEKDPERELKNHLLCQGGGERGFPRVGGSLEQDANLERLCKEGLGGKEEKKEKGKGMRKMR